MSEQFDQQAEKPEYYRPFTPSQNAIAATEPSLPLGIIGGLLAAVVGGIVWAVIVVKSGYEVGFVAWGIGLAAGFTVILFARGKSVQLQVVAVLAAAMGILIGKYVTFVHALQVGFSKLMPGEPQRFGYFASESFRLFRTNLGDVFSGWDLIWIGLAVISAWRIAQGTVHRPATADPGAGTTAPPGA
jgi:hypothetical protein